MTATAYYQFLERYVEHDGTVIARYRSTELAGGAWQEGEQHMSPATGVIAAELERFQPRSDMRVGRLSFDIWGMIHMGEFKIETRVIRPGRTIQLVESLMKTGVRTSVVGRTWRMKTSDTSAIAGIEDPPVVSFEGLRDWDGLSVWPGGHNASIQARVAEGYRRGKGVVWVTSPYDLVEGVKPSPFVRMMGLIDTMNGVYPRVDAHKERISYPNLDLQIHLFRMPVGEWLGIEGTQQYGDDGIGLTSARLHDEKGPFGHAEQILTLRRMDD